MSGPGALPLTCEECCGLRCRFRPALIRKATVMIALILSAHEDVSEAIGSHMAPWQGASVGKGQGGFGPTDPAEWAWFVSELQRAWGAGHQSPEAVARFLCPLSDPERPPGSREGERVASFDDPPDASAY